MHLACPLKCSTGVGRFSILGGGGGGAIFSIDKIIGVLTLVQIFTNILNLHFSR